MMQFIFCQAEDGIRDIGVTGVQTCALPIFLYDGFRVLGDIATPAIPKGQSVQVSVMWNASGVKGEHSLRATADKPATIGEEAEGNNTAHRLVTVTGGRVVQGTFAQN